MSAGLRVRLAFFLCVACLLPAARATVTVDGGATRVVTASDRVRDTQYVIGSTKGVGKTSTLRVETGGRLLGQYTTVTLGNVAGATGVVHLAGGEFPALVSVENVTNISYVKIGSAGTGLFTNDHGKVYLRESCELGLKAGSFGRYVHDGGAFGFSFGGKPFAVGVLGRGELDAVSGRMNLQDLLIGGTDTVDNVVYVREGATVAANARISVGGYTNRMNKSCLEYPAGRGRIAMLGGTIDLVSTSAEVYAPILQLGRYPRSFGEIRGRGEITSSSVVNRAYVGFGNGRIVGDGGVLDCTDVVGTTNFLGAADAGWFAEGGGALWLPRGSATLSGNGSATVALGATPGRSVPDLANSAFVKVSATSATAVHRICGGLYAADRDDVHREGLPASLGIVGFWKFADCSTISDWLAHPQDFKSAVITLRYDEAKLTRADSRLMLLRRENGAWKKLVTSPRNETRTVVSPSLGCLTGSAFNLGEFALVEIESFTGNVTDPISRAASGWYEIGNADYLRNAVDGSTERDGASATKTWYVNMACPSWRHLTLTDPKRVRFVGGVVLADELPADVTYDFDSLVSLVTTTNRVFSDGRPIRVPFGAYYRFMPSILEENPENGKLVATLDTRTGMNRLRDDLVLDGTMYVNDTTGNLVLDGALTGTGLIRLYNYYRYLTLAGRTDFDGTLYLGQVQNDVTIAPALTNGARVGTVSFAGTSASYAATQLTWMPPQPGGLLTLDNVTLESVSGWDAAAHRRYGGALTVRSNGVLRVKKLTTKGSGTTRGLHLLERNTAPSTSISVTIDEISAASRLFLNTNVNVSVGTVKAASVFDCTPLGSSPNDATFRVTGPHPASCRILADSPVQLPREIVGYTGQVEIASAAIPVSVNTNRAYRVPAGTILPASGTLTVSVDTEMPAPGRYAVLTWSAGCALSDAAAWPVTLVGRASLCTVERMATGLYLVVPALADGVTYYVDSELGDDAASGLSPETPWRSLAKVNSASIQPGESVLFRRGGLWRGQLKPKSGRLGAPVVYGAYGRGEKPILQQSAAAEAPGSWEKVATGVWRTRNAWPLATYRDIGNIIFNHGAAYGWKRWSLDKLENERDYWYDRDTGHVYLKSWLDPTSQWTSIELSIDQHVITEGNAKYVTYDGLAIRYGSAHGIGGGNVKGIVVKNCDVYWIGGGVLSTKINDDGSVSYTRYGNGIEFWGASSDCLVVSNRLWEIYDAAMTDQSDTGDHTNVVWAWNTVWNAEYSYEHFNRSKDYSVTDITVEHNTFVDSGGAWAHAQRPDRNGAPLMIWYSSGPVKNFTIRNNVFVGTTEQGIRQTTDWHRFVSFSNNLFYTEGQPVVRLVNQYLDFAGYKALGWDVGSVFGEPRFADPAHNDYRPRPGSPAIALASDGLPAGASAEVVPDVLYYAPKSSATAMNEFGRYVYAAENWTNAAGVATRPATGDVLVVSSSTSLTAGPSQQAVPVSGLWYRGSSVMNQGTFHLQAGGMGITNSSAGSQTWYCGVVLHGTGDAPVFVPKDTSLVYQRYFDQSDGGAAVLVKRGGGLLAIQDGSHQSTADRATWKRTRLEAGEFRWSPTGAGGKAYDLQTFPAGHELTFADDGSSEKGAVFSLGSRDSEWRDVDLREASPLVATGRRPRHVVTSGATTNVCVRFTGTPRSDPLDFGGAFTERAGLWWNPDGAAELRLTNATSTTLGEVRVSRGTLRLAGGATFTRLASLSVEAGASFAVDAGAGLGFVADRAALAATATVTVGAGVTVCFRAAVRDGTAVPSGNYTAATASWMKGAGMVVVGEPPTGRTVWNVTSGATVTEANDVAAASAARLYKLGAGTLLFEGAKSFVNDMTVSNGVVVACGDESLGGREGTTTFELVSSTVKGVLKVECAPGRNTVSFNRPITFHYAVDGEHGEFLYLPENATVNFYGLMQTSIAPPHRGPGYPNHWKMSCPSSCTVNWYGGMFASLNHVFPGGTHYIHKALTGGDRFSLAGGAKVYLLDAGNSIGAATGGLTGGSALYATVPYALTDSASGRGQALVFSGAATLDLCGCDQALAVLSSENTSVGVVTSAREALLHVRGSHVLTDGNGGYHATVTNRVKFTGRAGVSMERDESKAYPLVLLATSPTEGELRVVRNRLVLAKGASWPNCRQATVAGGRFVIERGAALGERASVVFERGPSGYGQFELCAGVTQKVARLLVDGVPQHPGTYGSSISGAAIPDDRLFAGGGLLRVGTPSGAMFILR